MQSFLSGVANTVYIDLANKTTGNPITEGTVTAYLKALTGTNANKWFRASDSTWQVAEASAGTMTYENQARWIISIVAAAWVTGVRYAFYAAESGNLHFPYTEEVLELHPTPLTLQEEATVT